MPATKNQLKRLEIIDELLSRKKWGVDELLERINDKLDNTINKRTLFRDIQYLIEEKDAPIHRPVKLDPFYYYTQKYSIKNVSLDFDEITVLRKSIDLVKEAGKFPFLEDAEKALRKLENRFYSTDSDGTHLVQFENHTTAEGGNWFEDLYEAIQTKTVLALAYQPYTASKSEEKIVHPYFLKEYRNRWFLFGRVSQYTTISIFALDRIKGCKPSKEQFIENDLFDPKIYFRFLVGVSVPANASIENVSLKVEKNLAPYILSKPIHQTQKLSRHYKSGDILIDLEVIINYELKSIILSYGNSIIVKSPASLRNDIQETITNLIQKYNE